MAEKYPQVLKKIDLRRTSIILLDSQRKKGQEEQITLLEHGLSAFSVWVLNC